MAFQRVIIDGDSLLYRCGFAAVGEPIENALHSFKLQVQSICDAVQCKEYVIYIKGEGNFRDAIAVTKKYKGNRTAPPPENYAEIREYAMRFHGAIPVNGMEADDQCSAELWAARENRAEPVIVAAIDKDLWNTPGWHYNYFPGKQQIECVTLRDADRNFIRQLLTGDASDNIPGLPLLYPVVWDIKQGPKPKKVGAKTAQALMDEHPNNTDALRAVYDAYIRYGMLGQGWDLERSEAYLLEQGRLLWMTRRLNADGSPVLWEIPEYLKQ